MKQQIILWLSKWGTIIITIIGILCAIAAGLIILSQRPTVYLGADKGYRLVAIEEQVQDLNSLRATVTEQFKIIQETLDAATNDPNTLATVGFQVEIRRISTELKSLRDALGSDIERTLSVPLLRKDVKKIEERLEELTTTSSKEIDRIYDQSKWFLGLMGTMAVGLFGLAISNLLQTRRKEVNT